MNSSKVNEVILSAIYSGASTTPGFGVNQSLEGFRNVDILGCVPAIIKCAFVCQMAPSCTNFNYKSEVQMCELFTKPAFKLSSQLNCTSYQDIRSNDNNNTNTVNQTNLSLMKPTCQSSMYVTTLSFSGYSWLAVDGVAASNAAGGQCSHTTNETPPKITAWWMVDLLGIFTVVYVRVFARIDYIERYTNLTVGLTNISWSVQRPVRNMYGLCGYFDEKLTTGGVWFRINCTNSNNNGPSSSSLPLTARYIIIQHSEQVKNNQLALCEVQVIAIPCSDFKPVVGVLTGGVRQRGFHFSRLNLVDLNTEKIPKCLLRSSKIFQIQKAETNLRNQND
ncbi:hypothetical protein HELRODRAFT_160011 [Helobdella robusta]|uniref:Fucolectin tachylectin-4 pentraxin-1 domain-containing protein n=1 Tax=Helobdella robusta TaxID=6412 RepID=T1EPN5_HELRO|nr:hypothetical protein HELRODRAFT_160011 [Helobdella robusta]ESO05918.1 hypothetical protein HELRODRAFT_160011 [Helobdella robusta]